MSQAVEDRASSGTDRRRERRATVSARRAAGRPRLRLAGGFWRLCRANPELRLERDANGELIVMPPQPPDSGHRNAGITAQLWYLEPERRHWASTSTRRRASRSPTRRSAAPTPPG